MKAVNEQERSATITVSEVGDVPNPNPNKFESKNQSQLSIRPNQDISPYNDKPFRRNSSLGDDNEKGEKTNPAFDFG